MTLEEAQAAYDKAMADVREFNAQAEERCRVDNIESSRLSALARDAKVQVFRCEVEALGVKFDKKGKVARGQNIRVVGDHPLQRLRDGQILRLGTVYVNDMGDLIATSKYRWRLSNGRYNDEVRLLVGWWEIADRGVS